MKKLILSVFLLFTASVLLAQDGTYVRETNTIDLQGNKKAAINLWCDDGWWQFNWS